MPGLSYAMMRNYQSGGPECSLFFSHAVRTCERSVTFATLHDSVTPVTSLLGDLVCSLVVG